MQIIKYNLYLKTRKIVLAHSFQNPLANMDMDVVVQENNFSKFWTESGGACVEDGSDNIYISNNNYHVQDSPDILPPAAHF